MNKLIPKFQEPFTTFGTSFADDKYQYYPRAQSDRPFNWPLTGNWNNFGGDVNNFRTAGLVDKNLLQSNGVLTYFDIYKGTEIDAITLKKGDILVFNGHTEIYVSQKITIMQINYLINSKILSKSTLPSFVW